MFQDKERKKKKANHYTPVLWALQVFMSGLGATEELQKSSAASQKMRHARWIEARRREWSTTAYLQKAVVLWSSCKPSVTALDTGHCEVHWR